MCLTPEGIGQALQQKQEKGRVPLGFGTETHTPHRLTVPGSKHSPPAGGDYQEEINHSGLNSEAVITQDPAY